MTNPGSAATTGTSQGSSSSAATLPSAGFVADNGNFADGWLDRLPPELKDGHQTLSKYRDLPSLAKSHVELQKLLGTKSSAINVPTDKSSPEEIAAFRKAIGAPEKPEDYKLKPEKLPDGIEWNEELGKGFASIAQKHNLPASAMRELTDFYLASEQARGQEMQKMLGDELKRGQEELRTAWGGNYDKNLALAVRGAKSVGLNPESPGLRDPEVVKALVRMAGMMSEDKLVTGGFSPTAQIGPARARDIMTNKTNPLFEKYQNGDPETVAMVRDLLKN